MRYVFRAAALLLAMGFVFNLAVAQKALDELPEGAANDLAKPGDRESHQGPANPMQGNRSNASGRFGGPATIACRRSPTNCVASRRSARGASS